MNGMTLRRRAAHFGAVLLSWPVERYITAQRDRLASAGVAIAPALTEEFRGWFSTDLLESVRIVASGGLHLPAVPFESILRRFGMDMPGAQFAAAMTFDNVVAVREDHPPARAFFFTNSYTWLSTGYWVTPLSPDSTSEGS